MTKKKKVPSAQVYPFLKRLEPVPCKSKSQYRYRVAKCKNARIALIDAINKGVWLPNGTNVELRDANFFGSYWWHVCREAVIFRDRNTCTMCGLRGSEEIKLHVHHILPRHCGGSDNPLNLRTLCEECHKRIHEELRERGM